MKVDEKILVKISKQLDDKITSTRKQDLCELKEIGVWENIDRKNDANDEYGMLLSSLDTI